MQERDIQKRIREKVHREGKTDMEVRTGLNKSQTTKVWCAGGVENRGTGQKGEREKEQNLIEEE